MSEAVYEVVAQAARYWFLLLMALIVWRSYRWYHKDRKQRKKRLRLLPDAGYVGELVVLEGSGELPAGRVLPVSSEGMLGCLRGCDLYVPVRGVGKKHLWYSFDDENGLLVEPCRGRRVLVDGMPLEAGHRRTYLAHGSRLQLGEAVLRLRLFAGFEQAGAQRAVAHELAPEAPDAPVPPQSPEPQTAPSPAAPAFTAEQWAALQQMQQAQAEQWMRLWQAQQAAQQPVMQPVNPPASAQPTEAAQGQFAPPMSSLGAAQAIQPVPAAEAPQSRLSAEEISRLRQSPFAPLEETDESEEAPPVTQTFAPPGEFYPPEMDEEGEWPYAPFPQSDATFVDDGYTYPEYVEEPDKSLYVEPDEAEKAKKLVWDRFLKGGGKL